MVHNGCTKYTIWTEYIPQYVGFRPGIDMPHPQVYKTDWGNRVMSTAGSESFVMDSLLGFSASHLAYLSKSTETRNLAYHHGGVALKGLQQAIGSFSKANSDAVFIASVLLSWQATDWYVMRVHVLNWLSLRV